MQPRLCLKQSRGHRRTSATHAVMTNWPRPDLHNAKVVLHKSLLFTRRVRLDEFEFSELNLLKWYAPGVVLCFSTVSHIKQRSERIGEKIEAALHFLQLS